MAQATRRWIGNYSSFMYLAESRLINQVLEGKQCTHFRLFKKTPIFSFTQFDSKDSNLKRCNTCYLKKYPHLKHNLVIVGPFLDSRNAKLHEMCSLLESEYILYHKIDSKNLSSAPDVKFLKHVKPYDTKSEMYGAYLFGMKIDFETVKILLEHRSLLKSILQLHRCMYCLTRVNMKHPPPSSALRSPRANKLVKSPQPICKRCKENGEFEPCTDYYTAESLLDILQGDQKAPKVTVTESAKKSKRSPMFTQNLLLDTE